MPIEVVSSYPQDPNGIFRLVINVVSEGLWPARVDTRGAGLASCSEVMNQVATNVGTLAKTGLLLETLERKEAREIYWRRKTRRKEIAEYSQEDADEVFRHLYATLTAAMSFLIEMKVANPEGAKRFACLDNEMIDLHTSLEDLWIDCDADEHEEREQEREDAERADISKIVKEDAKDEVEEENEQNERLWEECRADYKLPPGWPLDYPR